MTTENQLDEALDQRLLEVALHARCILSSGVVTADPGWRELPLPHVPTDWSDVRVLNPESAQEVLPLDVPAGTDYLDAWRESRRDEDRAQADLNASRAFRDNLPMYRNEWRCVDRHGDDHWLQQVVTVRPVSDGRWQILSITTDVTELRRETAARHQAEAGLRAVLTQARCILWHAEVSAPAGWEAHVDDDLSAHTDWRLTVADAGAARRVVALDVPAGQTYAEAWLAARHPEDRARMRREAAVERALLAGERRCVQEFRTIDRHGVALWLREDITLDAVGERHWRVVGVVTDITALKQAEAERLELERRLAQHQRLESLGVLAGGVAHDFNNLLQGILGYAELIGLRSETDAGLAELVAPILSCSRRATELCRQMLAYAGRSQLASEPVDLAALCRNLAPALRCAVPPGTDLQVSANVSVPLLDGDPAQLQQILMELVLNGAEALGGEPGAVNVSVDSEELPDGLAPAPAQFEPLPPGRYVRLLVADTGCGLSPGDLQRIFEPFFTRKFVGRGLGLSAVRGMVLQHRGAVAVQSAPGQGTLVTLWLPARDEAAPRAEVRPRASAATRGHGTILVVDDEPAVRTVAARMLGVLGYAVLTAEDGLDALGVYAQHRDEIGLVLLDLKMPRLAGPDCLARLRRLDPDVTVVVASGYSEAEAAELLTELPVAGLAHKPYDFDALRRVVVPLLPADEPTTTDTRA